jgi:hypothetical protein
MMVIINQVSLDNPQGDIFSGVTAADIALDITLVVGVASGEQVLKQAY